MSEKITLDSIKSYTEMRSELYKWVRKFLNASVGKEIPGINIDYWNVDMDELYVKYYDEEYHSIMVRTKEFLEFINKSK